MHGWWLGIIGLGLMGCTAVFPPAAHLVLVQSDPPGATVSIDGEVRGVTPVALPLRCDPSPLVRIESKGYQPVEHPVPRQSGGTDGRFGLRWPAEKCQETFTIILNPIAAKR